MALPSLTPEQRTKALEKAGLARKRRAEVKAELKQRKTTLSEVLKTAESDEAIARMKVQALLESLPRVGTTTAIQVMENIGISPARRVRGLGPNQREELIRLFN